MIRRSVRPGHSRDNATGPPLARAIRLRAKRPTISVEIRLRLATDTPCPGFKIRSPPQIASPPWRTSDRRGTRQKNNSLVKKSRLDSRKAAKRTSKAAHEDWMKLPANPFNPETRSRHHLETGRISRTEAKRAADQDF